jgi:fatty acid desaturase
MDIKYSDWTRGKARKALPKAIIDQVNKWIVGSRNSKDVEKYNRESQLKLMILFLGTVLCAAFYKHVDQSVITSAILVLLMGTLLIPYTRIFMHSQMHWGLSNSKVLNVVYSHIVSVVFGVTQTGYSYGHKLHHRFDNDFNPNGFPKDLQSTYVFSRDGQPSNKVLWMFYYMFFYQQLYVNWLVLKRGKLKDIFWALVEISLISGVHFMLFQFSSDFYLYLFLPALFMAWCASSLTLYEMHNVPANDYHIHPTVTSVDSFFNWYGDNDGYHLEHSLFASLHPSYLKKCHKLLDLSESQIYKKQYAVESLTKLFARN